VSAASLLAALSTMALAAKPAPSAPAVLWIVGAEPRKQAMERDEVGFGPKKADRRDPRITDDGLLREAVFKGLRDDLQP
jgi:hypothetical protein